MYRIFHFSSSGKWAWLGVLLACLALAACGSGSGSENQAGASVMASDSISAGSTSMDNVAPMVVDYGLAGVGRRNVPYVSVTVCRPGTTICQTIDHILVDTGSSGLRIMAPDVLDAALNLPAVSDARGNAVGECEHFGSGVTWGAVRAADVRIAGEAAANLPIQVIGGTSSGFAAIPNDCSGLGLDINSVALMGAKGILGVGLFKNDCGTVCASVVIATKYYGCSGNACTPISLQVGAQVTNPVSAFATDNNGVVIVLPSIPESGAAGVTGSLIFGVGTRSNNQVGGARIYAASRVGNFTTTYKGRTLTGSFLDSGSNGLFFQDASIPICPHTQFYCPTAPLSLTAVNTSANGLVSDVVNFVLVNIEALDVSIYASPIGGPIPQMNTFSWGLPFFYGRRVFVAMSESNTPNGPGPYWAY